MSRAFPYFCGSRPCPTSGFPGSWRFRASWRASPSRWWEAPSLISRSGPQRLVAGLVAVSSSIYISYAGWVMQQTGMALLLALFGWNIRLIQTGDGVRPLRLLSLGVLGAVSLYYSFVFAPIVVVAAIVCAAIVARRLRGESSRRIVATGLALVCVVVIPAAAYAPWHQARSAHQTQFTTGSSLAPAVAGSLGAEITGPEKVTYLRNRLATALALLHLEELAKQVAAGQTLHPSEDVQWAYMRYGYTRASSPNCGVLDLKPEDREKALQYLGDNYVYCTPIDGTRWLAVTAQRSYLLGSVASVLMIMGTIWALWRRRDLLAVLVIPWAWLAVYALFIALDRYAIPIWPYKVMFGFLLVFGAGTWVLRKLRPRGSDSGVSEGSSLQGSALDTSNLHRPRSQDAERTVL